MAVLSQMIVVLFPQKFRQLFSDWRELPERFRQMLSNLLEGLWRKQERRDKTPEEKASEIQTQVAATYSNLRYGLAVISFLFPVFLWRIGQWWYGMRLQNSMSAYYWAISPSDGPVRSWLRSRNIPLLSDLFGLPGFGSEAPVRIWFVGILFLLGFFLYLYKGFRKGENYLLNIGGLSAVGVALFPMKWECLTDTLCPDYGKLHAGFALTTFCCIGLVALFYARDTLNWIPLADSGKSKAYTWWYYLIGVGFVALVVIAIAPTPFRDEPNRIFYLEWGGIWAFALYWWIKSNELSEKRKADDDIQQFETRVIQKDPELREGLAAQNAAGSSRHSQAAVDQIKIQK
jgi:hypothetical protein